MKWIWRRSVASSAAGMIALGLGAPALAQPTRPGPVAAEEPPATGTAADRIAWAEATERFEQSRERSFGSRQSLYTSLLASGIGSAVIGGLMFIPDGSDHALRAAALPMALYGATNAVIGGVALAGLAEEREHWRSPAAIRERHDPAGLRRQLLLALEDAGGDAVTFALNIGLDVAYATGGAMAIVASQLGVDHPDRWLASGVVLSTQALHLIVIDAVGLAAAEDHQSELLHLLSTAPMPLVSDTQAGIGWHTAF